MSNIGFIIKVQEYVNTNKNVLTWAIKTCDVPLRF